MDVHLLTDRSGAVAHPNRRRIDLPCEALDLTPPPHRLDLMLLQGAPWTLLVHSPTGRLLEVRRWLATTGPDEVQEGGGLDPHVLRAEFAEIPGSWQALLEQVSVRFLHLSAAGVATLFLESGEESARWTALAEDSGSEGIPRHTETASGTGTLSPRQFEAVSLAVSMGYYEVPHRVNQRDLAERLGMSLSGLSRLLRRAEASIILAHMDAAVDTGSHEARFESILSPEETRRARPRMVVPVAASTR